MKLKKILPLFFIFLLLVGCSSTTPAIKNIVLNELTQDSYIMETTVKLDVGPTPTIFGYLDPEEEAIIDTLKAGIRIEHRMKDYHHIHLLISVVDDQPLRKVGLWKHENPLALEAIIAGDDIYLKSSADKMYIKTTLRDKYILRELVDLDFDVFLGYIDADTRSGLKQFAQGELSRFIEQYEFKVNRISDKGTTLVQTPSGSQSVRNIEVTFGIDEMIGFAASTLRQLAEYENLKELVNQYFTLVEREEEEQLSDEEIEEAREDLKEISQEIGEYSETKLEEELNASIDMEVKSDLGLTSNGDIVKNDINFAFKYVQRPSNFSDFLSLERFEFNLQVNTLKWDINQPVDVEAPSSENYLLMTDVLKNRKLLEELGKDSLIESYIRENFPRTGYFNLDSRYMDVGNDYLILDEPIYIESGYTMVPLVAIGRILYSDPIWNSENQSVTFENNDQTVVVFVKEPKAIVNGEEVQMTVPAVIKNGRAFVPLRFITEQLGGKVVWEPEYRSITVQFE